MGAREASPPGSPREKSRIGEEEKGQWQAPAAGNDRLRETSGSFELLEAVGCSRVEPVAQPTAVEWLRLVRVADREPLLRAG